MRLKVLSLAAELDQQSIYSDFALSKADLETVLGSARTTIYDWCGILWLTSSDYRAETPQLEDGSFDKGAPLSPYQVWLLSRIKVMMQILKSQKRTKAYIKANPNYFSKARFDHLSNIIVEKTA